MISIRLKLDKKTKHQLIGIVNARIEMFVPKCESKLISLVSYHYLLDIRKKIHENMEKDGNVSFPLDELVVLYNMILPIYQNLGNFEFANFLCIETHIKDSLDSEYLKNFY
jgi:hypothetical protein